MDAMHSAECLEQAVAFIGVFLFVPLTGPEQSREIQETIIPKRTSYAAILLLRIGMAAGVLVVLVTIFSGIMTVSNCTFPFWKYVFGTVISALMMGSIGFGVTTLCNSVIAGYFAAIGYYMINLFGISGKSRFSIFSMSAGEFETKYWLGAVSIVCVAVVIFYTKIKKK